MNTDSRVPKIVVVSDYTAEVGWNKHLLNPLKKNEKVIVINELEDDRYITVRHAGNHTSVFAKRNFKTIQGKLLR